MKQGDEFWSNQYGVCIVADYVTGGDESLVIAAYAPPKSKMLKYAIVNDSDVIPIEKAPQLEKLQELIKAGAVLG